MKYIEKHFDTDIVAAHKEALIDAQLDEESLSNPAILAGRMGGDLYEMVCSMPTFQALKQQMYEDQGGICCYCGMELKYKYDCVQCRVEHVRPKTIHPKWVGEYSNLLLSCKGSEGDGEKDLLDKVKEENRKGFKKYRKSLMHCDEAKGSIELTYTPLQPDCATHFQYDINGNVSGNDEGAEDDVKTLGLQCDYLKKRRKAAIEGYIFNPDLTIVTNEELEQIKDSIMERKSDKTYREFCFVIQNAIEHYLIQH